jgi:hypothetical protein
VYNETIVAIEVVEEAATAIEQVEKDMKSAEKAGLTTRKPKMSSGEVLNASCNILSDLSNSENAEDKDDE